VDRAKRGYAEGSGEVTRKVERGKPCGMQRGGGGGKQKEEKEEEGGGGGEEEREGKGSVCESRTIELGKILCRRG